MQWQTNGVRVCDCEKGIEYTEKELAMARLKILIPDADKLLSEREFHTYCFSVHEVFIYESFDVPHAFEVLKGYQRWKELT